MFMDVMGRVSGAAGQFERADSLLRAAVALKEGHLGVTDPGIAESLLGLGESLMMQNHLEEAERILDRAHRLQVAAFGSSDARTLKSQNYLGFVHFTLDNPRRAEELLRGVIAKGDEPELRGRPEILDARYTLARVLDYYGNHTQAEVDIRAELRRQETERGPDHSKTVDVALQLGRNLVSQGKLDEAAAHYTHVRDVYERVYGGESVFAAMGIYSVAQVHHRRGALRDAEEAYRAAARIYATHPSSSRWHAYARVALGQVLVDLKRPQDAERELRHGLRLNLGGASVDQEQVAVARTWLGRALAEQRRYAEAEPVLLSAYDSLAGRSHMARQAKVAARHLVALYRAWNRPNDVRRYEALMSEAKRQPAR